MGEAELSLCGEIMVDKRIIGQIEGFRLVPDTAAGGTPSAADKAEIVPFLTDAYYKQAARFIAAPHSSLAVGHDGFVRWQGQIIAKLAASDDVLRPQCILLADEYVSDHARECIAEKIHRFVSAHFETLLKPLFDLSAAETLTDNQKNVANCLLQNLGSVPRYRIAAAVKDMNQEARADLRRFGVRFGVYNIFIPALLKPAAASAATLLWALSHNALDKQGYGDIVAQLAAGRTSFPALDGVFMPFYRLGGYRLLGKKAVRIDMLERCADLIRKALAWNPAEMPRSARPEGAYDGKFFTASPSMLSILGATPEDIKDILQHLHYVSHAVSQADYEDFLRNNGGTLIAAAAAVPPAEPVGDFAASAASLPQHSESESVFIDTVPAAEPIGAKFSADIADTQTDNKDKKKQMKAAEEILLWRYQKPAPKKQSGQAFSGAKRRSRPADNRTQFRQTDGDAAAGGGRDNKSSDSAHWLRGENKAERAEQGKKNGGWQAKRDRGDRAESKRNFANAGDARGGTQTGAEKRADSRNMSKRGQKGRENAPRRGGDGLRYSDESRKKHSANIADSPFAALLTLRDKLTK